MNPAKILAKWAVRGQAMSGERANATTASGNWRVHDWIVDLDRGRLFRQRAPQDEIRLNARLSRVFGVLIAGAGETVSSRTILETVWRNRIVGNDSVSTAIYQLRRILDTDTGEPSIIETVPGSGYRLLCEVESIELHATKRRPLLWAVAGLAAIFVGAVITLQYSGAIIDRTVYVPPVANSTGLNANDGVSVMLRSRIMNSIGQNAPELIATVSSNTDSGFTLESELIGCESGPAVVFRLVETHTQRHVWSEHFDMSPGAYDAPVQDIAVKRVSDTLAKSAAGSLQPMRPKGVQSAQKNKATPGRS